jgi:peroxiredoxin
VSFDTPENNATFAATEGFQYELWSDDDRTLADYYGANAGFAAARVTKLLDEDGDLILHYVDAIDVGTHPEDVLADCQQIFQ